MGGLFLVGAVVVNWPGGFFLLVVCFGGLGFLGGQAPGQPERVVNEPVSQAADAGRRSLVSGYMISASRPKPARLLV